MATTQRLGAMLAVALAMTTPAVGATVTKETLRIDSNSRTYYMFVPDSVGAEQACCVHRS